MTPGLIERYRDRLPVSAATPVITLGEGGTPLLHAPRVSERAGCDVYLKYEGANPTGSFKDRGMTVAVSKAVEDGAREAVCASTGNTSASAAAYCGRAGLSLAVVLPEGAIARGKLAQAQIAGARVIAIQGDFDDALGLVRELVARRDIALLNSVNPYRLEGQKTAAFEVVEQLERVPDWVALPVGNGGNITAYWKGFGEIDAAPRILAASRLLAQGEGVFCEPASAASVAALLEACADGLVEPGATVVCVLTGHGLKDPDTAGAEGAEILRCPPQIDRLEELAFATEAVVA